VGRRGRGRGRHFKTGEKKTRASAGTGVDGGDGGKRRRNDVSLGNDEGWKKMLNMRCS
jgi:hypothetical protein